MTSANDQYAEALNATQAGVTLTRNELCAAYLAALIDAWGEAKPDSGSADLVDQNARLAA